MGPKFPRASGHLRVQQQPEGAARHLETAATGVQNCDAGLIPALSTGWLPMHWMTGWVVMGRDPSRWARGRLVK